MTGESPVFVDTNVLLYSIDTADSHRCRVACRWMDSLWASRRGCISWQVLNEFYENAVRKFGVPPRSARGVVETFSDWSLAAFSLPLLRRAWRWMDTAELSYWDSLIVASAEDRGCQWLLSEDFQHGRAYGSVRVIDPFQTDLASVFPTGDL